MAILLLGITAALANYELSYRKAGFEWCLLLNGFGYLYKLQLANDYDTIFFYYFVDDSICCLQCCPERILLLTSRGIGRRTVTGS